MVMHQVGKNPYVSACRSLVKYRIRLNIHRIDEQYDYVFLLFKVLYILHYILVAQLLSTKAPVCYFRLGRTC